MTIVADDLANDDVDDRFASSGAEGKWGNVIARIRFERQRGQKVATVPDDTAIMADQRQRGGQEQGQADRSSDITQRALRRVDQRRAVKAHIASRLSEGRTEEAWDAYTLRVTGMQKWEGRVVDIDDGIFTAELVPFGEGPEVIADFPRDRISEDDDLQVGDVIYVTVRMVRSSSGGPTVTSGIRVRRLGRWTEAEIADQARRAKERAARLASYIE